jgi:ceramide glucosyltransferase
MNPLAAFAAACIVTSLGYYAASCIAALRFAARAAKQPPPTPKIAPRVAILKPLHGLNTALLENLTSYLELDYRRVEYLFGVSSYDDPAADVPVALKAQYPFAQVKLVVGERPGCANRKVAKLINMAERVQRAEIILLADADISVDRSHLQRIVGELCDDQVGMVTCLYRAKPSGTLASRLGALFINTDFVPLIMLSNLVEPMRYGMGATIALKKCTLDAIGGFNALKDMLADDYYLGKLASEHGCKIRLSTSVVTTSTEEKDFAEFWKHQIRWARTYRSTRRVSIATIVLHAPFWGLVLLAASQFSLPAVGLFAGVVAARIAMARLFIGKILGLPEHRKDAWLVPFKDLIMTAIWVVSLFSNEVLWAGRRLIIQPDGTVRELNS